MAVILFTTIILTITTFSVDLPVCTGIPVDEELTLTYQEKHALEKFSKVMDGRLTQEYMKTPIYLIKWLRYAELDIAKAEAALLSHLKYRAEYNLDTILNEDWGSEGRVLDEDYPIYNDGEDFTGRPVFVADISDWDVRRAILAGKKDILYRHMLRKVEQVLKKIRDKQQKGENVTQFQIILDLKGYNVIQHGCLNCISLYLNFVLELRSQYPNMTDNAILVNTPPVFETVTEALGLRRRAAMKIFGTNKRQWQDFIFSIIPRDQLPEFLDGTRVY